MTFSSITDPTLPANERGQSFPQTPSLILLPCGSPSRPAAVSHVPADAPWTATCSPYTGTGIKFHTNLFKERELNSLSQLTKRQCFEKYLLHTAVSHFPTVPTHQLLGLNQTSCSTPRFTIFKCFSLCLRFVSALHLSGLGSQSRVWQEGSGKGEQHRWGAVDTIKQSWRLFGVRMGTY